MADSDEDNDLPWNEAQWEEFMKRSDARSAKFGELFETFIDHPDRDEIIDHEMGWDKMEEEADEEEMAERVEEMNRICEEALDDPEIKREMEEHERQLESMPAYQKAVAFALKVHRKMKFLFSEDKDEEPDEDLCAFLGSSHLIGAKIAGGHGMGYEDDALCGNIVNCKRALKAAEESLTSLEALRSRQVIDGKLYEELKADAEEARRLVAERIQTLRKRVWWD